MLLLLLTIYFPGNLYNTVLLRFSLDETHCVPALAAAAAETAAVVNGSVYICSRIAAATLGLQPRNFFCRIFVYLYGKLFNCVISLHIISVTLVSEVKLHVVVEAAKVLQSGLRFFSGGHFLVTERAVN